jgi:hypothetical protein
MNSTISAILRTFVNKEQTDWNVYLPSVAYAVNTSFSKTLGQTPFYMLYRRMPINPAEINLPDPGRMPKQAYQILEEIVQNQTQAHSIATKKIEKAKTKMKDRYDKKVFIPRALKIGSMVYLNKPVAQGKDLKRKLCSFFFSPYVITTFLSPGIVKLRHLSDGKFMQKLVHISRLKLAQVRTPLHSRIPQENDHMEAEDIILSTPENQKVQKPENTQQNGPTPQNPTKVIKLVTTQQQDKQQANKEIVKPDRTKTANIASTTVPQALKMNTANGQMEYLPIKTISDATKSQGTDMQLRIIFRDKTMRWLPITALNAPARQLFYKLKMTMRSTPSLRQRTN